MISSPNITARVLPSITGSPCPNFAPLLKRRTSIRLAHFGQEIDNHCQPDLDQTGSRLPLFFLFRASGGFAAAQVLTLHELWRIDIIGRRA